MKALVIASVLALFSLPAFAQGTTAPGDMSQDPAMQQGSPRARILKLADRISNLTALGFVHDVGFVKRYVEETRAFILPHARQVNADMFRELSDLLESRGRLLPSASRDAAS